MSTVLQFLVPVKSYDRYYVVKSHKLKGGGGEVGEVVKLHVLHMFLKFFLQRITLLIAAKYFILCVGYYQLVAMGPHC